MAGFKLIKSPYVTDAIEELPISSLTLAVGDMIELDVGATTWTEADASTEHWQKKAVVQEAVTTAATVVKAIPVLPGQLWEVEGANNSAAADNGDRMLLTDKNTVNNTGTDNTSEEACFIQRGFAGVAADKRLIGEVVYGSGINPDAA